MYVQIPWECELCHNRNAGKLFDCEVCNYPRPLRLPDQRRNTFSSYNKQNSFSKSNSLNSDDGAPQLLSGSPANSIDPSALPTVFTPNGASSITSNGLGPYFPAIESIQEDKSLHSTSDFTPPPNAASSLSPKSALSNILNEEEDEKMEAPQLPLTHHVTFFGSLISDDGDQSATNIKELILKVTNGEDVHSIQHKKVEEILLLCHKAFTDSETMLQVLLDRVSDPGLSDLNTRIRGVNMCHHWMQNYWKNDFQDRDTMLDIMEHFVDGLDQLQLPPTCLSVLSRIKKTYEDQV